MVNDKNVSEKLMAPANGNGPDARAWLEEGKFIWQPKLWKSLVDGYEADKPELVNKYPTTYKPTCERMKVKIESLTGYIKHLQEAIKTTQELTEWDTNRKPDIPDQARVLEVLASEGERAEAWIAKIQNQLEASGHREYSEPEPSDTLNDFSDFEAAGQIAMPLKPGEMPPKPKWLIEGWLLQQRVTMHWGKADIGKTFLAIERALSIIMGIPYLGKYPVNKTGSVWYISADRQPSEILERFQLALRSYNLEREYENQPNRLKVFSYHKLGIRFDNPLDRQRFIGYYQSEALKPVYCPIDSLYGIVGEWNISSSDIAKRIVLGLHAIIPETDLAFDVMQHSIGSGAKEYGDETLRGAVDLKVKQEMTAPDTIQITVDKFNSGAKDMACVVDCLWNANGENQHEFIASDKKPIISDDSGDKNADEDPDARSARIEADISRAITWLEGNLSQVVDKGLNKSKVAESVIKATGVYKDEVWRAIKLLEYEGLFRCERGGKNGRSMLLVSPDKANQAKLVKADQPTSAITLNILTKRSLPGRSSGGNQSSNHLQSSE